MKKILLISTATLALVFTACNHEPDFDGLRDYKAGNQLKLQVTYGGTYTGKNGFNMGEDNPDNPSAIAKTKIEDWLNANYYTAEKGSEATIKYNVIKKSTSTTTVYTLNTNFEQNYTVGDNVNIQGWTNFEANSVYNWKYSTYSGNTYAQCGNIKDVATSWLVSPKIKISKGDVLSFDLAIGYWKGNVLSVLISEDYSGGASVSNLTQDKAKWVDITSKFKIPEEPAKGYGTMAKAGTYDLSVYAGKSIYIAFRYAGDATKNTTVQLDNIQIEHQDTETSTSTVEKEARATIAGDDSKWVVTLPSEVPDVVLDEGFESGKTNDHFVGDGWLNALVQGTYYWDYKSFSGNLYVSLSANKHEGVLENWLVTPVLNLGKDMILSFDMKLGYYNGDALSLLISNNFDGEAANISAATWSNVTSQLTIDKSSTGGYDTNWSNYKVDLSSYTGKKVYVAFKYLGNGTKGDNLISTTYQLDNIYVGIPK
ncbi:DUF5017 domain-containing protein [Bacteroidaceae bacterium HV4-6-C5C]|nr:DUF5017 domain-containing protein [Bacteroidaceae bacterium HV4-6-C5C]